MSKDRCVSSMAVLSILRHLNTKHAKSAMAVKEYMDANAASEGGRFFWGGKAIVCIFLAKGKREMIGKGGNREDTNRRKPIFFPVRKGGYHVHITYMSPPPPQWM